MKNKNVILLSLFLSLIAYNNVSAQGKFAGTKKSMIGKTYLDSRHIPGLAGWKFREGSVLTDINDPQPMMVDIHQKGTTYIVLFVEVTDTATNTTQILDVIEIKNVLKGWEIKSTVCRDYEQESVDIVAHVKSQQKAYLKIVKQAWRLNRDKRRIEALDVKHVDCMNEGFGD